MFTINNPTEEDTPTLAWHNARYVVYQKEAGAEGTPHYQGYVNFSRAMRLTAVKKINGRAHWEPRRGTHEQARDYCMKEEGRLEEPVELGAPPGQAVAYGADDMARAAVDPKISLYELMDRNPGVYSRNHRGLKAIRILVQEKRNWETEIKWYWGPTGTGKSKAAFEEAGEDAYVHNMSTGKWFDGYEGQENVIFDDMRKDTFKYHELLRLFDRYPMTVEIKGGRAQWAPKVIWVTAPVPPDKMYDTREDIQQLLRRVDVVKHFPASVNDVLGKRKREDVVVGSSGYKGSYVVGFEPPK